MRRIVFSVFLIVAWLVCSGWVFADDGGLVAWWTFDKDTGKMAVDSVGDTKDAINGNFDYVAGVVGKAIKFDGQTTFISRAADRVPKLIDAFTIEAWIAPQTYSWNWTGIVDQAGKAVGEESGVGEQALKLGLFGVKYHDPAFGTADVTDTLTEADNNWTGGNNDWSARWRGDIEAPVSGEVTFTAEVDNGIKLEINKEVVIDGLGRGKARSGKITMEKGKKYPIVLSYFQDGDPSFLRLYWSWSGKERAIVPGDALQHGNRAIEYAEQKELGREGPPPKRNDRISFGIDSMGHLGVKVMVNNQLNYCVSDTVVPLLKWSHVAATFDSRRGVRVYLNGEVVAKMAVNGSVTGVEGYDMLIGMSQKRMSPTGCERGASRSILSPMVFDGLIDEVKIYDSALASEQIKQSYMATKPADAKPLNWRVMPSGPKEVNPTFGAAYCRLNYAEEWEKLWRVGPDPDILVTFDKLPIRVVFWRGTSYGASWVAENGKWMGDQSLEATGNSTGWGCSEHMSDKQCRYSHVKLIENNDARVVVHWRYAISDIIYGISRVGLDGWGEWADEYYYIYPDGVSTRKQILHSKVLAHEWQETIALHQPDCRPEDDLELQALTWANMDGETKTYTWEFGKHDDTKLRDATIQMVNMKSQYKPFIIFQRKSGMKLMRCCVEEQWTHFPWWNHWPVGQLPNDGRRTGVPDRPAHSSLAQAIEDSRIIKADKEKGTFTAVSLYGMTQRPVEKLVTLARSWNYPAPLTVLSGAFKSQSYNVYQRAYVLTCTDKGKPSSLELMLAATEDSPVVNAAFVIKGWGDSGAELKVNGKPIKRGKRFRFGYNHKMEGTDLIVWLKRASVKPLTISISPKGTGEDVKRQNFRKEVKTAATKVEKGLAGTTSADDIDSLARQLDTLNRKIPLRLPSGPKGMTRFGAYYTTLKYDYGWDKLWPIADDADVVVRFDEFDHRFVFWRGTSYIPCWATYDGAWYTNEFFERRGYLGGCDSMCEPMSDKQCRYSHARIIESTDARVIVHWRYSPVDLNFQHPYRDKMTGWGDWVDEYYTIYPDSIGVRKATIHTGSPQKDWIEYQESIVVNQPGTIPEDNLNFDAVSFANLKGQSKTYTWTKEGGPELKDAPDQPCIQVINFKNAYKPFTIVNPEGVRIKVYDGHGRNSCFNWWNHWPVKQEKSDTTEATSPERASHSSLAHVEWKQYSQDGISRTWVMLHGMTNRKAGELAPLGKSWLYPAELNLRTGASAFSSEGYDQTQRAYVLNCKEVGKASSVAFTLAASEDSPVISPGIVIKDWGRSDAALKVNGQNVPRGKDFRLGHRRTTRSSNLILWVKIDSVKPVTVSLSPVSD